MYGLQPSYKLSEIPENLGLSPRYLLGWWGEVIKRSGHEVAQQSHDVDFKLARELWVASAFAVCKRAGDPRDYWISAVSGTAPDALVFYFEVDEVGAKRNIYEIEVTTFDDRASSIEEVLGNKLAKSYSPTTRIVCYVTRSDGYHVDLEDVAAYVNANNPSHYEVWVLDEFTPERDIGAGHPIKLTCLNNGEDYQVDLFEEQMVANHGDAVWVPAARSINQSGEMNLLGTITLEYPAL